MKEMAIQEIRAVQLQILNRVDAYCRKNEVKYFLAWGTLLGAARHGGYIPWDDDIDLMMFRPDYDKFRASFAQASDGHGLEVRPMEGAVGWPYPFTKVSDLRTRICEDSDLSVPIGVNIDIFPIDGHAATAGRTWLQEQEIRLVRGLLVLKSVAYRPGRAPRKRLMLRAAKLALRRVPAWSLVAWFSRCARRYEASPGGRIGVRVGPSDWGVPYGAIGSPKETSFEGRNYWGPEDMRKVLTSIYGDYMRLPPVEQQVTHHRFSAFWK